MGNRGLSTLATEPQGAIPQEAVPMEGGQEEQIDQQQQLQQIVMEVVQLLLQGVPPEELEKQGVPKEIIGLAIQAIQEHQSQQANTAEDEQQVPIEGGLSAMGMRQ